MDTAGFNRFWACVKTCTAGVLFTDSFLHTLLTFFEAYFSKLDHINVGELSAAIGRHSDAVRRMVSSLTTLEQRRLCSSLDTQTRGGPPLESPRPTFTESSLRASGEEAVRMSRSPHTVLKVCSVFSTMTDKYPECRGVHRDS